MKLFSVCLYIYIFTFNIIKPKKVKSFFNKINLQYIISIDLDKYTVENYLDTGNMSEINKPDKFGNTPLMIAVANNNVENVKLLIKKGADVNFQNDAGSTALHIAFIKNNLECSKILLNNDDIDVSIKDNTSKNAFFYKLQ